MNNEVIMNFLLNYGLIAIFMIILLEYACFPISSEFVLPVSGLLAAQLGYHLLFVTLLSVLAGWMGSSVCYFLGRIGGERLIEKLLKRFPKARRQFDRTCSWQRKYGKWSVMLGRAVPIFRTYISWISGLVGQSYLEFTAFSAIGIFVWNLILLGCGYLLQENFQAFIPYVQKYLLMIVICLIALIIFIKWAFKKYSCVMESKKKKLRE